MITKVTTYHRLKPWSTLDISRCVYFLQLDRSEESNIQEIKVHLKTIPLCQKKKKGKLKFSWTPSASVQQVPQPSNSIFPYSVGSSFWTPRSGSTKWQTNIGLSFDSVYIKKSYWGDRKFLLRYCFVKLLVYWKQIWR